MDMQCDVCADCTEPSPQWASVNRGVLLCDECSSVHRQLGRHISEVKHLYRSRWRQSQLDMVRYLASTHANRFWEHVLYEPMLAGQHNSSRETKTASQHQPLDVKSKKPKPKDPLYPVKAEFIREKYMFLGFFKRPRNLVQDDLNQQLHASVRTGVLETSVYLLTLGADPNFVHPTKGTSPMHVACQYGQIGQVEVLLAYGADLCSRNLQGQTPIDLALDKAISNARSANSIPTDGLSWDQKMRFAWSPLVDSLVNAYYEVTDSLAYFLSRSAPNHKAALLGSPKPSASKRLSSPTRTESTTDHPTSQHTSKSGMISIHDGHFLIATSVLQIPGELCGENIVAGSERNVLEAKCLLNQLPTLPFENLCIDVYDEADRRLVNSFLETMDPCLLESTLNDRSSSTKPPARSVKRGLTLYFLPPNTNYSSVRNQARQKLGRLSAVEFHTLVLDILTEVAARLLPLFPPLKSHLTAITGPESNYDKPAIHLTDDERSSSLVFRTSPLNESKTGLSCPVPPIPTVSSGVELTQSPTRQSGRSHNRCDDPVYDQVATDSDFNSLTSAGSAVARSPTVSTPTSTLNGHSADRETAKNSNPPPSAVLPSIPNATRYVSTKRHLPSRSSSLNQNHRASVPAASSPTNKAPSNVALSPILEAANLAFQPSSMRFHSSNSVVSTSDVVGSSSSHMFVRASEATSSANRSVDGSIERCCVTAQTEVQLLRKENAELRSHLSSMNASKKETENRFRLLEQQMHEMTLLVESLKEEKSTLMAAFSAGMVLTHSPPKSVRSELDETDQSVHSIQADRTGSCNEADETEDYDRKPVKVEDYAVGSECLDSGIMLRQGVMLRPTGDSRESSPVILTPSSRHAWFPPATQPIGTSQQQVSSNSESNVTSTASKPPPLMPKPVFVCAKRAVIDGRFQSVSTPTSKSPIHTAQISATVDDYTAPNSTGSPSPAPRLVTHSMNYPVRPPSGHLSVQQRQQELQKQHAQILASIATLPDYDTPLTDSQKSPTLIPIKPPVSANSQHPTSECVVRSVEVIITHIRTLVQLANGERSGDFSACSRQIQSAAQDILKLFPPRQQCPPSVQDILSDLAHASQNLQPYCDRLSMGDNNRFGGTRNPSVEVNALIHHARQIAKSAKDLLAQYQTSSS